MDASKGAFFGVGSRGIRINFTLYSKATDWWILVNLLFEYGVEDQVILQSKTFQPFKPHIYEKDQEQGLFVLDIVRITLNIVMSVVCIGDSLLKLFGGCCSKLFK